MTADAALSFPQAILPALVVLAGMFGLLTWLFHYVAAGIQSEADAEDDALRAWRRPEGGR